LFRIFQAQLRDAIDDLLATTALWNTEWFNKSKFHVLLHLPDHVRRFGPAILFATEGFESYNAIIRLRSVHSTHQAPSADIAHSFSHLHAVRHLICGGAVTLPRQSGKYYAGERFRALLHDCRIAAVLGLSKMDETEFSHVTLDNTDGTLISCYICPAETEHCELQTMFVL
jgi:hypothetical protein